MKKIRKLWGVLVALAVILAAVWTFPSAASAEETGEDQLITEITLDNVNYRLLKGKPYAHTTTLGGDFANYMEIVGQKWIGITDTSETVAAEATDSLEVTVGNDYYYCVTLQAKTGYRFQKEFNLYSDESSWKPFDLDDYDGSISDDGKTITITKFIRTTGNMPTVRNVYEKLKLTATVTDGQTGDTKNYSTQEIWEFTRLDTDNDGFHNMPGDDAKALIQDAKDWVIAQGVSEYDMTVDQTFEDEKICINGTEVENPRNYVYYEGDTVDRYYTVVCTITGSIPKTVDEIKATITTTFEPGKKPSIAATSETEGVAVEFAAWWTHSESSEVEPEVAESPENWRAIYSKEEYNDPEHLLTEVLPDTEYDLYISFYITDSSKARFADKVTIKIGKDTYVAEGDEVYNGGFFGYVNKTLKTVKFDSKVGWQQIGKKWYYYENGKAVTGWKKIGKKWYRFNKKGEMLTGWQQISKKWYYFNKSGAMLTGWQQISKKWYYFDASGAMLTGWQQISKKWYYFDASGAMLTGWQQIGKKWYYFNVSGAMLSGWQQIGGKWYFLKNGIMVTGWQQIGGKWYFFSNGAMVTGSKTIGGKVYNFNASGVCLNP